MERESPRQMEVTRGSPDQGNIMTERLSEDDVADIAERLNSVRTKARTLGRVLKVSKANVDSIFLQYLNPQERLMHILDEFMKLDEPTQTWGVILSALRKSGIGEARLASAIERDLTQTSVQPDSGSNSLVGEATHTVVVYSAETSNTSQPIEMTTVSQPVGTTTVSQPVEITTVSQPVETTTVSQPVETTTVSQPVETTTVSQPVETTTVSQPVETTTVSQPVETTTVSQPVETTTVSQPVETTTVSQPVETTTVSQPVETTTVSQPVETTTVSQPVESTTVSQPVKTTFSRTLATTTSSYTSAGINTRLTRRGKTRSTERKSAGVVHSPSVSKPKFPRRSQSNPIRDQSTPPPRRINTSRSKSTPDHSSEPQKGNTPTMGHRRSFNSPHQAKSASSNSTPKWKSHSPSARGSKPKPTQKPTTTHSTGFAKKMPGSKIATPSVSAVAAPQIAGSPHLSEKVTVAKLQAISVTKSTMVCISTTMATSSVSAAAAPHQELIAGSPHLSEQETLTKLQATSVTKSIMISVANPVQAAAQCQTTWTTTPIMSSAIIDPEDEILHSKLSTLFCSIPFIHSYIPEPRKCLCKLFIQLAHTLLMTYFPYRM